MKTLKNFTQKLNLNSSKIANLTNAHTIKGGLIPLTGACAQKAQSRPTNTFTALCGNDTVDTQI
ncbi:hypothetical protein [uncultured Kordia sp.]|uniref:hypothetical protein n=1 Tax=uncultured Kordia sp. TaxID=507699 RepID=UPI002623B99B|nr:hypothetical protein [uncultured Kordia sp.]